MALGLADPRAMLDTCPSRFGWAGPAPRVTQRGSRFLRYLLVGLDAVALVLAWLLATEVLSSHARSLVETAASVFLLTVGGLVLFNGLGLYRARVCSLRTVEYARLARACTLLALLALAGAALVGSVVVAREIVIGASVAFVLAFVLRGGYRTWVAGRRRAGQFLRPILLVGAGEESVELAELLMVHPELGYRVVGLVGDKDAPATRSLAELWCGEVDDVQLVIESSGATGVIVCGSVLQSVQLNATVNECLGAGVHVQLSAGLRGFNVQRLRPLPLAHEPLFYVEPMKLSTWQLALKRSLDAVFATVALLVSLPVFIVAAIGIKLQDRGPVLFRQTRVGRNGEPFTLYKLRTMRVGAEHETSNLRDLNVREGPLLKIPHDPRVSRFGRLLRSSSIDEIPQLLNVLNGTMSMVGPRPALPDEVVHFDDELRAREAVRPGITGLWQVEGRDNPSFAAYRRFDLFYIQNWSVALDLMILVETVEAVAARIVRGVLTPGSEIQLAPPEVTDPSAISRKRSSSFEH